MRFLIITHVEHFKVNKKFYAYAPYVREMNIWFKIINSEFRIQNSGFQAEVVAPLISAQDKIQGLEYEGSDIVFTKVPSFDILSIGSILLAIYKIPLISFKILKAMNRADHLHLRCPGNIGLLTCILQIFFPKKRKTAKYAGNWDPQAKQPWAYKLQRWILNNTFLTRNISVLVYGEWPGQSKNIRSFFTASFSEKVALEVNEKVFLEPYRFVFVGNLVPGKGLKMALEVVRGLMESGVNCEMEIYGEGPERIPMEAFVQKNALERIRFMGSRSLEELKQAYQRAHFLILPSKSEGWPKVVAEGMFFGCIPLVTEVSCLRWMLGDGERGVFISNTESHGGSTEATEENVERILEVLRDEERMQRMSKAARAWSQQYTLERFEKGIREVLEKGPSTSSG